MSAVLKVINNFVMELNGITYTGKQGDAADDATDTMDSTVNGQIHAVATQLATGAAVTVWDEDDDVPVNFQYLFIWSDKAIYVQLIGQTSYAIVHVAAGQPFVLPGYDELKVAVSTTPLSGTEPVMEDIDSIVIQNNSGDSCNYLVAVVN